MISRTWAIGCVLAVSAAAWAVRPATWTDGSEKDFAAGKMDKTVLTSRGEVRLARAMTTLVEASKDVGMISALALDRRGRVFVAASPKATVFRAEKGKLVEVASLPGVLVRCMGFVRGRLIAGTSGKDAGLYAMDAKGKAAPVWTDKAVTFVWAFVPGPKNSFYVATGPEGKIYHVSARGKAAVIYDSDDQNILSLAAAPKGLLYAGTGENGLVLEVDPARKTGRILYDADESEIARLLVDKDGILYAATSDVAKSGPTGEAPESEDTGRPDGPKTRPGGTTAPSTRPTTGPAKAPPGKAKPAKKAAEAPPASAPAVGKAALKPRAGEAKPAKPDPMVGDRVIFAPIASAAGSAPAPSPRAPTSPAEAMKMMMRRKGPSRPPGRPSNGDGAGNAVYRIDAEGFVQPVFRRPVSILAMVARDGVLTLGTGAGGEIFAVNVAEERTTMLVKIDPKHITALAVDAKGKLVFGTADQGGVYALDNGVEAKGTLISKVFDARHIARWGTLNVQALLPAGTAGTIATRSGNVAKPEDKTWAAWSAETPVGAKWAPIKTPAGRFLQYRLTLTSRGRTTPTVDQVHLIYQVRNLAPVIKAVQVGSAAGGNDGDRRGPGPMMRRGGPRGGNGNGGGGGSVKPVRIRAADPNGDEMWYALFFRRAGNKRWIKIADKLTEPAYKWNTAAVADGAYEVRVEVTDARANPPGQALTAARISRPVVVDNTAPQVADLAAKPAGKAAVALRGVVADKTGRVDRIAYAVNTNTEWVAVLPADGICDSQKETFAVRIKDLEPGTHLIAVQVADDSGNIAHASVEVTVAK